VKEKKKINSGQKTLIKKQSNIPLFGSEIPLGKESESVRIRIYYLIIEKLLKNGLQTTFGKREMHTIINNSC
jgi:hypothetical protein